jgi:hypothetical protein
MTDSINGGLLGVAVAFGFIAGFYFHNYYWTRLCLRAVLVVLWKLDRRGVFMSPYDRAIISIAHKAAGGK